MNDYWGRYTPGMFKPLEAAIWSLRPGESRVSETQEEERARRRAGLSTMARIAFDVFHGLCTEYMDHGCDKSYHPKLKYWASRLERLSGGMN